MEVADNDSNTEILIEVSVSLPIIEVITDDDIRPLAKVNLRASNSVFLQLNSFLNQIVFVYSYSILLISENA